MAVQNLGTNPINLLYEWVSFTPVSLISANTYSLGIRFLNTQPELLFSYFGLRLNYEATLAGDFYEVDSRRLFYSPGVQIVDFRITPNLTIVGDVTIQVARFPVFKNTPSTANCDVNLLVDNAIFY